MALSWDSVQKAWRILNAINPKANNSWIQQYDKGNKYQVDTILGHDHKQDDGWENVFMNVKDITPEQLQLFESRKKEVPNSEMITDYGNGITMIGWF